MPATRTTTVSSDGRPERSHAYSSWRARTRALVSGRCTGHLGQHAGRRERRLGRLVALVPRLAAGTRHRLLERLRRQHAEPDREAMGERDVAEPARRLARDVLEVRRLAANHAAKGDDRGVAAARRGRLRGHRQLEGAWHPDDVHRVLRHPVLAQAPLRPLEQALRDDFVVAADDDGHATGTGGDRKSTRLNSSHLVISYAVFCLKKKKKITTNNCMSS